MAKQRLFPEHHGKASDTSDPRERFSDLATKVFTVPKSEIDEREKAWRKKHSKAPLEGPGQAGA